jgi:hypothetical protein
LHRWHQIFPREDQCHVRRDNADYAHSNSIKATSTRVKGPTHGWGGEPLLKNGVRDGMLRELWALPADSASRGVAAILRPAASFAPPMGAR